MVAVFNVANACRNVLNTKSSIKEDIRTINQIVKSDPAAYQDDDTKRRQVLSLKVAISNKQTVQVGSRTILERSADLVHRKVLDEYLPASGDNWRKF